MLKHSLLVATLLISPHVLANTIFIGDSIADGYKKYNKGTGFTKVGANPKTVLSYVHSASYRDVSKVILSSGISNNCHSISTVKDQLFYLSAKPVNIILLGNNNCNGANDTLKLMCSKYSNCKFESIPYGRDGIHPNQYNKKF